MAKVQQLRTASELKARLNTVYSDLATELKHDARVHAPSILGALGEINTIMVHETDGGGGSIARSGTEGWYNKYRNPVDPYILNGVGPHLAISADGTVTPLVELPYKINHGGSMNGTSIGVETGHCNDGRSGNNDVAPDLTGKTARHGWQPLSTASEDVSGSGSTKYFAMEIPRHAPGNTPADYPLFASEVVVSPWTTSTYQTPAREPPGLVQGDMNQMYFSLIRGGLDKDGKYVERGKTWKHAPDASLAPPLPTMMAFSEWQYRSWALLSRYLCEALLVPRNFPVMPHARRDHATNEILFKQLVLADERFDMIVSGLQGPHTYHDRVFDFVKTDFTESANSNLSSLRQHYGDSHAAAESFVFFANYKNADLYLGWLRFFDFYRGVLGHAFPGNVYAGGDDHDCPGSLFDWHRFAREVWDWWWLPFDFDAMHASTSVPDRPYRRPNGQTPLVEYYFYDQPAGLIAPDPYAGRASTPGGIQGAGSSPETYMLEEHSPVYALANGEVVAARYPAAGDVSMAFVLVRHEVFHVLDASGVSRQAGTASPNDSAHGGLADAGRIDYSVPPATVYSLYMHLGRPDTMSFTQVDDHNPDWLNRVLARMKECDLALPSPATTQSGLVPALDRMSASFTSPPSSTADTRLTPLASWVLDQREYRAFLTKLSAGEVAVAPFRSTVSAAGPTPMRVILGDFLGVAGVIRKQSGVSTHGLRVEVFSPTLVDPAFTAVILETSWQVPGNATRQALFYQSEWSRTPTSDEATALRSIGVDPANVAWWGTVAASRQYWDVRTPASAKLPTNGCVFHYKPSEFMQWVNDVTWTSEWSKYRVVSGSPSVAVPRPAAPRPRRF